MPHPHPLRLTWALPLAAIALTFMLSPARAGVVAFDDFSRTDGLTLNGTAASVDNGIDANPVLRLVPTGEWHSGSAFSSTTITTETFSTFFQFRLTEPGGIKDLSGQTGADGFVFAIQPVSSSIGGAGGDLGYGGISPSVGIEFDTFHNNWDPGSNHIGIDVNGSNTSVASVNVTPDFDNGSLWSTWIDYDGTTLEVRASQDGHRPQDSLLAYEIDIAAILGQTTAYIGFTAGTGKAWENHDIIRWEYRDQFRPVGDDPSVPEPATLTLIGLGGLAVLRRRWR